MSFGFGVGDFLAVGKLVWGVYRAYADAPEQFRDFSQEILSLHIVIRQVEDELDISGSGGVPNLSTKAKNDLEILYDGLEGIMKELDDLLKKYQDLSENHSISFDRLKWGQEDLVRLRDKLRSNLTLLITFNSSLANCQLAQQKAQLVEMQEQLGQLLGASRLHHRGSVASLASIASFARSIGHGQKEAWKEAWNELSRELYRNGVTADMIKAKKDEICQLFKTATVLSFSGIPNREGEPKDRYAQVIQQLADGVKEVLSMPARRAPYVVTRARLLRGASALHVAAARGRTHLVKVLLDKGANIHDQQWTENNYTALHAAVINGHSETVQVLLDRGASIDGTTIDEWTALHWGVFMARIEVVKVLLDRGVSIDAMTKFAKSTALHAAVDNKVPNIEILKVLLDKGASIDATTHNGSTALRLAACHGNIEIVKMLLARGACASINVPNKWGNTPLHTAAQNRYTEVVKLLLENGANTDQRNKLGKTALDIARQLGWEHGVKLLVAHIAKPRRS